MVGFDTETTSPRKGKWLDVQRCQVLGYSVAPEPNRAVYYPHPPDQGMVAVLEGDEVKVVHNAKFEIAVLGHLGIALRHFHDTKLAAYLLAMPAAPSPAGAIEPIELEPRDAGF